MSKGGEGNNHDELSSDRQLLQAIALRYLVDSNQVVKVFTRRLRKCHGSLQVLLEGITDGERNF